VRWPRYEQMKASGVAWLGEVPGHWSVKPLGRVADVRLSNVDKKSVDGQRAVRLCNYVDVYYSERISSDGAFMEATASEGQVKRFSLQRGDVLLTKDSETPDDIASPAVVSDDFDDVVCGYHLALLRPTPHMDGRFLSRAISASPVCDHFFSSATGVTRFGLSRSDIATAPIPTPPLDEQRAIAAFLDRETARIDALVAAKRRLIALLQEKRAALIAPAVTRGLDADAPTKDSGVAWLGRVPAHWEVMTLARLTDKLTNGYVGPTREMFVDEGVPYLQSLHIKNNNIEFGDDYFVTSAWSNAHRKSILREDDVLVVQTGDIGQVARVDSRWAGANCHALIICSPNRKRVQGRYLSWLLCSEYGQAQLESLQTGALHPHLNCGDIKHMLLPVPPLAEQASIAAFLDAEATATANADRLALETISRLTEYRSTLITSAVTGRIDVRAGA
jgi:type I restriction enzyme S subunit